MNVGIDEPGHKGTVTEVDDFGSRRTTNGASNLHDAVSLDEDFAGLDDLSGFDVKKARGVEDDGMRSRSSRLGECDCRKE
jgi:hypothetical protein